MEELRAFCEERGIRYATDHDAPHVLMDMVRRLAVECMKATKAAEEAAQRRDGKVTW